MRYCLLLTICLISFASAAQNDTVRVAHFRSYDPYCSVNPVTGESEGLLIDWWNLLGKKQFLTIIFVPCGVDECVGMVQSGETDAIAGMFADTRQMDSLVFGDQIIRVKTELLARTNSWPRSIYKVQDSVGVLNSSPALPILRRDYPHLALKIYEDYDDLEADISDKAIKTFIRDTPAPVIRIETIPSPDGYEPLVDINTDRLRPALLNSNTELLTKLQVGSAAFTELEVVELARKHEIYIKTEPTPWPLFLGLTSLFIVILGAVVLRFNKKLNTQSPDSGRRKYEWQKIITEGESDTVEFKSSMRYDLREQKANKVLEYVIVKTISAFMNTNGGVLFIGINDVGEIVGIEHDYAVTSKPNADGFLLVLTNLINKHFGKDAHRSLHAEIINLEGKDICVIESIKHSEPVFIVKGDKEEFYVRAAAASVPLGMKEAAHYVREHW